MRWDKSTHKIIGTPSAAARLCPSRVNDISRRASASTARPRKNPASDGDATAITVTNNAITAINSTSVNARLVDRRSEPGCRHSFIDCRVPDHFFPPLDTFEMSSSLPALPSGPGDVRSYELGFMRPGHS